MTKKTVDSMYTTARKILQEVSMKEKIGKSIVLLMISVAVCYIPMLGYYPLTQSWLGAIGLLGGWTFASIPIMIAVIYNYAGVLTAMKYGTMLVTAGFCIDRYRRWFGGNNVAVVSIIVTVVTASLELMDWWMSGSKIEDLYGVVSIILLTWSTTIIFSYFVNRFMWNEPRRLGNFYQRKNEKNSNIDEMLKTSAAIKNLANNIQRMSAMEQLEDIAVSENMEQAMGVSMCRGCENGQVQYLERARLNYLWYNKMLETREAMAIQLNEVADIIEQYTRPTSDDKKVMFGMEDFLKHKLREKKIVSRKIKFCENSKGQIELKIIAKKRRRANVSIDVMNAVVEKAVGKEMRLVRGDVAEVSGEFVEYTYMEELNFITISGAAKRTRQDEDCSGDNYTYVQLDSGQTFMSICDGMGSGQRAADYSELVIELLEQLLESGFAENTILKLINSVLLTGSGWQEPAAVDMALIDQYSGICQFLKLGAASTFIKRGNWVECITSTSLPMGVLGEVDVETITKKLYNGDFVIMVSDGIVEALNCADKEAAIGRIIMEIDTSSPREMAMEILTRALEKSDGVPKDDMTIVCTGIWDKI